MMSQSEYSQSMRRSRRSHTFYSARRRGQALLLAVLVLVFAALLGTTFIAVVAINIGQTSRTEERDKAKAAAQAGLEFVNRQLTFSEWGSKWRPNLASYGGVTPAPSNDSFYWTAFEQAQGWSADGNYAKFPDPRSVNQNISAPNYMAKVEKVLAGDTDNVNGDKTGMLRISVIGLSTDDPNSFYKVTAYKAGPAQQPLLAAARSVTNWDFANGVVPNGRVVSYTSGTPSTLVIDNLEGQLPTVPFYITVGGINLTTGASATIRGQAVVNVETNTPAAGQTRLTLPTSLQPTAGSVTAGDRVEVAAAIGAPSGANTTNGIDFDNDGTVTATREQMSLNISSSSTPGSVWANGGLLWYGNTSALNLNSTQNGGVPGFIRASGLMRTYSLSSPAFNTTVAVTGTASGNSSFTGTLATDSLTSFPGTFSGAGAGKAIEVIEDGLNRLNNSPATTRQIKPFTPPDITLGSDGLGRYRQLTKYSTSTDSGNPQGAAYGYGQGIYINNPQDRERILSGSALRDMTQAELRDMWFSDKTGNAFNRKGTPVSKTTTGRSLEEQHLRGWIGPDEFCPRGALIQINDNGTITISLDPREDGYDATDVSPNEGPSPFKAWRNADGTLAGNDDGDGAIEDFEGGVYSQTFPWPANGVIFAEGNVRVRGETTSATRSLTVVSMNNIYIEDSLSAGTTHKVLLLARKNVVVNPTRVVRRADTQTLISTNTAAGDTVINVQDASGFNVGDWIIIDTASANDPGGMITNITGNQLTLNQQVTAQTAPLPVRIVSDPVNASGVPYNNQANRLERFAQALQRRVSLPAGTTSARLALRHSAERRDGLQVEYEADPQGIGLGLYKITRARLGNKKLLTDPRSTIIQSVDPNDEKYLSIEHDQGGPDEFPKRPSGFADQAAAEAYDINQLATDLDNKATDPSDPGREWGYDGTVMNNYGANVAPLKVPPYFYLAAVGNRYDFGAYDALATPTYGTFPWLKNFFVDPYVIPMATSVVLTMNGSAATLRNDRYNTTLGAYEETKQFGFSFWHGAGLTNQADAWEDVLTVDQSFYNNGHKTATGAGDNTYYTLDSRVVGAAAGTNTVAFKLNPAVEDYFDATTPPTPEPRIPFYRLSRIKLENATFQLDGTSTNQLVGIDPGYTMNINAYVYAQEGSWYVIPGDFFDASSTVDSSTTTPTDVRTTHVNLPHNTSADKQADENLDLDRDGVESQAEKAAVYRYHRYNYQINFTGAIMENKTATVINSSISASNPLYGDVQNWSNKWATTQLTATDFSGGTVNHSSLAFGTQFRTIQYTFDPTASTGSLDSDDGFSPPLSTELLYQTG